eukprot:TRINITY_DN7546_c0_g1_i1.p1 TRINITY_DN7546_c0_g1~~TRINITY_DN7546_c0_g1_i1.p1  ORF type:complete len:113 (+),score=15.82 TRINITY_DN7546_c0_g1_i1:35-373(+)
MYVGSDDGGDGYFHTATRMNHNERTQQETQLDVQAVRQRAMFSDYFHNRLIGALEKFEDRYEAKDAPSTRGKKTNLRYRFQSQAFCSSKNTGRYVLFLYFKLKFTLELHSNL